MQNAMPSRPELARLVRESRRALRNVYVAERTGDLAAMDAADAADAQAFVALLEAIYGTGVTQ